MPGFNDSEKENQKAPHFFKENINHNVNLYGTNPVTTYSGVLRHYDHYRQIVVLNPYLGMIYDEHGKVKWAEMSSNFELPLEIIGARERTTSEDRLGRLIRLNRNLNSRIKQKAKKKS